MTDNSQDVGSNETNLEHPEMARPPFETKRGWYYISKSRKHGVNPLWVGPFKTCKAASDDADMAAGIAKT